MSAYLEPLEDSPRCHRWKLVVSVGSGKERRRKTKTFEGGKREAQAALREYEQSVHIPLVASSFYGFATKWNDARLASGAIKESTHEKYYWFISAVDPYLSAPIEDIRPNDIQDAYAALSDSWSGTSLRSLHNSLTRIFRAAQEEGLVGSSPMIGIDPPQNDTKERKSMSPKQAAALLSELDVADNRQFAVALILSCGLRRGEVCGLEWQDVSKSIRVRREVTKSAAGARDIPLDKGTLDLIGKRRRILQIALKNVSSKLYPSDRLCCGLDGRPLEGDVLRRWWERNRGDYGLEGWTLHELRHTYLTNLAQAGVHPAVMQKLAGHSSMNTTMQIYTHVHNDDMKKAMQSLHSLRQSAPKSAPSSSGKKKGQSRKRV